MKTRPFLTVLWLTYHLLLGNLILGWAPASRSELKPWEAPFAFLAFNVPALTLLLLASYQASRKPQGWPAVLGWSLLCSAGIQTAGIFTLLLAPALEAGSVTEAAQALAGGFVAASVLSGVIAIAVWPYVFFFVVNLAYFRLVGRNRAATELRGGGR